MINIMQNDQQNKHLGFWIDDDKVNNIIIYSIFFNYFTKLNKKVYIYTYFTYKRIVVDENLRLLEARRNGLQAKNEAVGQAGFPSTDLGVSIYISTYFYFLVTIIKTSIHS